MRETLLQLAPDLRAAPRPGVYAPSGVTVATLFRVLRRDQVGDEALVLALLALGDHDAAPDREVLLDRGLNRAKLDAVTPDLDHEVHASKDLEAPVGQQARLVAGAIHPGSLLGGEGILDEALRRDLGAVYVAPGQKVAADVELPGRPVRYGPRVLVEDVQAVRVHRLSDRTVRGRSAVDEVPQVPRRDLVCFASAV